MSNNTKIFNEAIAEAKAIRETAMANAKLALEEAFTPRIKEMMSSKLEALAEEDEMEEGYGKEMEEGNMKNMEEISLEELLSELEGLEEGEKEEMEEGKEEMEEGKEEMEEGADLEEAAADDEVGEITVDELKDIIRDVMADLMGGEEMEGEEMEDEEMESEEEISLDEILAEIASLGEMNDLDEKSGGFMKEPSDAAAGGLDNIAKAIKMAASKTGESAEAIYDKINNILFSGKPMPRFEAKELDEKSGGFMKEPSDAATGGANEIAKAIKMAAMKTGESAEAIYDKISNILFSGKPMPRFEAKELDEAMSTIATLRSELNEVNLLNAKLLYVNKLFKAKTLNESQKVKVINAFDRAETVKEAKNIYETLNESFSTAKKSPLKENLSFASKAVGVADRKVIVESNDFVARMQKLAGIK